MKKTQKITQICLAVLILILSVVSVNAQEITKEDLESCCRQYTKRYLTYPVVPFFGPYYSEESNQRMRTAINEGRELVDCANKGEAISSEIFQQAYEKIVNASELMYYDKTELELIIELNKSQNNNDRYFSDEMWSEFQSEILEAEKILKDGDSALIDEYYSKMMYQHNKLCLYNMTLGDVDGDGVFDIKDVTYFQKKLSEDKLNFSQMLVSMLDSNTYGFPDIRNATLMQKSLAGTFKGSAGCPKDYYYHEFLKCPDYTGGHFYKIALEERYDAEWYDEGEA